MKKLTKIAILGALLSTTFMASTQMMGGGYAASQIMIPTMVNTDIRPQIAWPVLGIEARTRVLPDTVQANAAR